MEKIKYRCRITGGHRYVMRNGQRNKNSKVMKEMMQTLRESLSCKKMIQ